MEKIFAWFKANHPDHELIYEYDSIRQNNVFYVRKFSPGALMFKKTISAADVSNSLDPEEMIKTSIETLIESMEG